MTETSLHALQADHSAGIAALHERGAAHFDPVRFHFIEALSRRAARYQGEVRNVLDDRLAEALQDFSERFERAQGEAESANDPLPQDGQESQSPLAALAAYIAQVSATDAGAAIEPDDELAGTAPTDSPAIAAEELKSIRYFRDTWSRLSVDQQLAQALAQAPENAGPLNSHLLMLRALQRMRDISPEYLNRFMAYADALLWLEQAECGRAAR